MNKLLAVFGILSVSGSVAFAQIRVGAGESWSYGFTSLARLGPEEVLLGAFYGGANLAMSSVAPGTHYTISIYENSLSDVPIWVTDSMVTHTTSAGGLMIWQDLQGWAQVQVITGALTIDQIQFDAEIPIDDTHVYHYKSMIPVGPVVPQSNTVTFSPYAASGMVLPETGDGRAGSIVNFIRTATLRPSGSIELICINQLDSLLRY